MGNPVGAFASVSAVGSALAGIVATCGGWHRRCWATGMRHHPGFTPCTAGPDSGRVVGLAVAASLALASACAVGAPVGGSDREAGFRNGREATSDTCSDDLCGRAALDGGVTEADLGEAPAPSFEECADSTVEAMEVLQPVDIIWVIDSSGSMRGEAAIVQDNMNNFVATMSESGIDAHVVVITSREYVDVPPPLGSDAEHFRFIDRGVGSNAALQRLLGELGQYRDFLRPNSSVHFVAVTDDESDMGWGEFQSQMESELGRSFMFHAIASPEVPCSGWFCNGACSGPNGGAADVGREYYRGATATMGNQFSICTADWSALFTQLGATIAVGNPLPCEFDLPPAPDGQSLDPRKVNVVFEFGSGEERALPRTESAAACENVGWYYDNPSAPTRVILCPGTCNAISGDETGTVHLALGCETILM